MNVLGRSIKGSEPVATDQIKEPQSATPRSQEQHTPASTRSYAGPSLISAALSVVGRLESAGDIQVDGKVEGEIRGQAVRIGSGAVIKGTVLGEIVELAGTIEGKIAARSVVLTRTAHISGDIVYQSLQIEQGAYFNGNSRPHSGKNVAKNAKSVEVETYRTQGPERPTQQSESVKLIPTPSQNLN